MISVIGFSTVAPFHINNEHQIAAYDTIAAFLRAKINENGRFLAAKQSQKRTLELFVHRPAAKPMEQTGLF